jgi:transposase
MRHHPRKFRFPVARQNGAIQRAVSGNKGGARRVDDRRLISGIIHVLKMDCRLCDCPADDRPSTTIYNRLNRGSRKRFCCRASSAGWTEVRKERSSAVALVTFVASPL